MCVCDFFYLHSFVTSNLTLGQSLDNVLDISYSWDSKKRKKSKCLTKDRERENKKRGQEKGQILDDQCIVVVAGSHTHTHTHTLTST